MIAFHGTRSTAADLLNYSSVIAVSLFFLPYCSAADGFCEGNNAGRSCCADGDGGLALPVFPYEADWNKNFRAFLYIVGLLWCFVGVSVLSDVFMAGIETITNSTYKRKVPRLTQQGQQEQDASGNPVFDYEETLIWNPAVANLTLMALGSSTPEILLSIIEIVGAGFYSGELGPGTVVGSASFNLYMITAMCMLALPDGEGRKIDGLTTFFITSVHSLFAYFWLAVTLIVISPDVVEVWEAVVTLGCFPWLTFLVWCADNNWFRREKVFPDEAVEDKPNENGTDGNPAAIPLVSVPNGGGAAGEASTGPIQEEPDHPIGRAGSGVGFVRRTSSAGSSAPPGHGHTTTHAKNNSRFRHRHNALSTFMGGRKAPDANEPEELRLAKEDAAREKTLSVFQFCSRNYAFLETVGTATIKVTRGGKTDTRGSVRYETKDDTASAGKEYEAAEGTLTFEAHETEKNVDVKIIHDKVHNPDLKFKVALHVPDGGMGKLGRLSEADVTIIDMDGPGIFSWMDSTPPTFLSSDSRAHLVIERRCGCTGAVTVRAKSVDGSARAGVHYQEVDEVIEWADSEAAKTLQVKLMQFPRPGDMEPSTVHFSVELEAVGTAGKDQAEVGDPKRIEVQVRWNMPDILGDGLEVASWSDQFRQALSVSGGEDVEEAGGLELGMHYLSITWKLLAAFIPPPHYLGGWACFWVALSFIGVVTMFINDLASIFGCLVGLDDQVTAITIVALGTSLPDTFASVLAIRSDDNADNAIGNITGSNSINVFLGLGLPWTVAAVYWGQVKATDAWTARNLDWLKLKDHMKYSESGAFVVEGGSLGFNTLVFSILTLFSFLVLGIRRWKLGYEIGGPKNLARLTSGIFVAFWILYILLSSIQVYHPDKIGWGR